MPLQISPKSQHILTLGKNSLLAVEYGVYHRKQCSNTIEEDQKVQLEGAKLQ